MRRRNLRYREARPAEGASFLTGSYIMINTLTLKRSLLIAGIVKPILK